MAYVALLTYVALLFVRPQDWVPWLRGTQFSIMDMVVGAAIVTWLGSLATTGWKAKAAPQNFLMLGLFAAVLMSHVAHTYFAAFTESFQKFGKVVVAFYLISSLVSTTKRARAVVVVMVLGCLFLTWHGFRQHYWGYGFGGDTPDFQPVHEWQTLKSGTMVMVDRVQGLGFFHDPNDLALILVSVLPFLFVGMIGKSSTGPVRVLSLAASVPIFVCIFWTNSRGGWLALGVMLVVFVILQMRRKKLALIVAAAVFVAVFAVGPSRMGLLSSSEGSAHERLIAWGDGNRMLKSDPFFGVGWGRFSDFSSTGLVAHNSYVHCWAELGLFGYFFWLGLVLACLKDSWALSRLTSSGEEEPAEPAREPTPEEEVRSRDVLELSELGKAMFACLAGYMAAAMFLSRTYIIALYVLFALVAAMRTIYERDIGSLPNGSSRKDWRWLLGIELASIPALYLFIRISH